MNDYTDLSSPPKLLSAATIQDLEAIASHIYAIADRSQGDTHTLLHLLRTLEKIHREIQIDRFQPSLPDSRQSLYALLRDIEENGGWPYIQRCKLQALFANLPEEVEDRGEIRS